MSTHTKTALGLGRGTIPGSIHPTTPTTVVAGMNKKLKNASQYPFFHLSG